MMEFVESCALALSVTAYWEFASDFFLFYWGFVETTSPEWNLRYLRCELVVYFWSSLEEFGVLEMDSSFLAWIKISSQQDISEIMH